MVKAIEKRAIIVLTTMLIAVFGLGGCRIDNVADPFTQVQILAYLTEKYDEEFVFEKNEFDSKEQRFSKYVYSYYPKNNPELSFFVVDQTIQAERIKHYDRILNDTYPHSLLQVDFHNIEAILPDLIINEPAFEHLLDYTQFCYDKNPPCVIELKLSAEYEINDVETISQQLVEVATYFSDNATKYKSAKLELHILMLSGKIIIFSNNTIASLESIKDFVQDRI